MARQLNTAITGKIDGYSFYHDRLHGYLVRRTGGVSSKQYFKDARYASARDASSEFAAVSKAGKLIRDAFGEFVTEVKDGTMVNRMNKELVALKQLYNQNPRGKRRPETLMADPEANKWLRIFQFNEGVKVHEILEIGRHAINRMSTKAFPEGATHAGLRLVWSVIDFEKGTFETSSSEMSLVDQRGLALWHESGDSRQLKGSRDSRRLKGDSCRLKKGIEIVCLQVLFFEEKDGALVRLKGKVHGMGVISITKCQLPIANEGKVTSQVGVKRHRKYREPVRFNEDKVRRFETNGYKLPVASYSG